MEVWNNWQNPYFKMKLLWWNEIGMLVQMHFLCVELLHMWHDDIFSEKDWEGKCCGRWQAKEFHHQPTRMLVNLTLPNLTLRLKKQLMIATSLKMKRNSQVCRDVECTLTRTTKSPCPLSMPCLAAHLDPILWQIQNCRNHWREGPAQYDRLTGKVPTPYINKDWKKIAKAKGSWLPSAGADVTAPRQERLCTVPCVLTPIATQTAFAAFSASDTRRP